MINIPTELLRTLVAVVDLRSFTKAALSLGVTQPAVSAQIKRLQALLDCDLFDKSAPGVSLTPSGKLVVNFARRMLSINDQIVDASIPRLAPQALRIGIPGDFATLVLLPFLATPAPADELGASVKADYDEYLWPLFDHFHRNPELSLLETETAARMADELRTAGFEVTENVGGTGLVASDNRDLGDGTAVTLYGVRRGRQPERQPETRWTGQRRRRLLAHRARAEGGRGTEDRCHT